MTWRLFQAKEKKKESETKTMAIENRTDEELMQEFERKNKEAKEANKSFDNFFFFLREDEKAIVHPLLNVPQVTLTETLYHEKFDHVAGKMVADCVCATPFGRECKLCKEAEVTHDKKLKATPRVFLPVYLHGIYKTNILNQLEAVTAKDDDGVEKPIKGVRMLKLKLGSAILDSLKEFYYDSDDRSILTSDFVITRRNSGLDTTYSLTSRKLQTISDDLVPKYTPVSVVVDVRSHRPEQAVEEPVSSNPFLPSEDAVPQMTVDDALDMKEPSPAQLKTIKNLCNLLDKDYVEPISWRQADSLARALREEYKAHLAEDEEEEREHLPLNGSREVKTESGVPVRH
jgi:hypothetical protein